MGQFITGADTKGDEKEETLGDRIRRLRKGQKLGLNQTAEKIGVSATYLSRIELHNETSPPREEVIHKLAAILRDDFDVLMRLANRIASDVQEIVKSDPRMPAFLRKIGQRNITLDELIAFANSKGGTQCQ